MNRHARAAARRSVQERVRPRYAYRTWNSEGGTVTSPLFESPDEAGEWRSGLPLSARLTLCVVDSEGTLHSPSDKAMSEAIGSHLSRHHMSQ